MPYEACTARLFLTIAGNKLELPMSSVRIINPSSPINPEHRSVRSTAGAHPASLLSSMSRLFFTCRCLAALHRISSPPIKSCSDARSLKRINMECNVHKTPLRSVLGSCDSAFWLLCKLVAKFCIVTPLTVSGKVKTPENAVLRSDL